MPRWIWLIALSARSVEPYQNVSTLSLPLSCDCTTGFPTLPSQGFKSISGLAGCALVYAVFQDVNGNDVFSTGSSFGYGGEPFSVSCNNGATITSFSFLCNTGVDGFPSPPYASLATIGPAMCSDGSTAVFTGLTNICSYSTGTQVGYLNCGYDGSGNEVCDGGCLSGAPTPCAGTTLCDLPSGSNVVNSFSVLPSSSLLLSPRGTWLAAGDPSSANIYLYGGSTNMPSWDSISLSALTGLTAMAGVNNLAWSLDETWFSASTSPGNTIVAWTNIGSTDSPIATTFPIVSSSGFNYAQSVAFSSDGLFLAYGEAGFSDVGIGIFGGSGSKDLTSWSRNKVGRLCCLPRDVGYVTFFSSSTGWCLLGIYDGFAIWCGTLPDPTTWPTAPLYSTTGNYYNCGAVSLGYNGGYVVLASGDGATVFGNGDSSVITWSGSPSVTFAATCPSQAGMYAMSPVGNVLAAVSPNNLYLYSGVDSSTVVTSWPTSPSQTITVTGLQPSFGVLGWDEGGTWIVAADSTGAVSIVSTGAVTQTPSSSPSPLPGHANDSATNSLGTPAIVGISVGGLVVVSAAVVIAYFVRRSRMPASTKIPATKNLPSIVKSTDVELGPGRIETSESTAQASQSSVDQHCESRLPESLAQQVVINPFASVAVETAPQRAPSRVCLQCGTTNAVESFCGGCGATLPLDAPHATVWQ